MSMRYKDNESVWTASLNICDNRICPMMGALKKLTFEAPRAHFSVRKLVALIPDTLGFPLISPKSICTSSTDVNGPSCPKGCWH